MALEQQNEKVTQEPTLEQKINDPQISWNELVKIRDELTKETHDFHKQLQKIESDIQNIIKKAGSNQRSVMEAWDSPEIEKLQKQKDLLQKVQERINNEEPQEIKGFRKEEKSLQEQIIKTNNKIEVIDRIDVFALKKELQIGSKNSVNVLGIKKQFIDTDGQTYRVKFVYNPDITLLGQCNREEGELMINIQKCEESYILSKENSKKYDLGFTDITEDDFVLSILAQEIWHRKRPADAFREDLTKNGLAMTGSYTPGERIDEALSELPSLEKGKESYFYSVRFWSVLDEMLWKDMKQDTYIYDGKDSYDILMKSYQKACEIVMTKNHKEAFEKAKKDSIAVIETGRELEGNKIARRKYKYIGPPENMSLYFDVTRNNAKIELFDGETINDSYTHLFARVGDLFDDAGVFNQQKKEEEIVKKFSFIKREDFLEIIEEYKKIVEEMKD